MCRATLVPPFCRAVPATYWKSAALAVIPNLSALDRSQVRTASCKLRDVALGSLQDRLQGRAKLSANDLAFLGRSYAQRGVVPSWAEVTTGWIHRQHVWEDC